MVEYQSFGVALIQIYMEAHFIFTQVCGHTWILRIDLLSFWNPLGPNIHCKLPYLRPENFESHCLGKLLHRYNSYLSFWETRVWILSLAQNNCINVGIKMIVGELKRFFLLSFIFRKETNDCCLVVKALEDTVWIWLKLLISDKLKFSSLFHLGGCDILLWP